MCARRCGSPTVCRRCTAPGVTRFLELGPDGVLTGAWRAVSGERGQRRRSRRLRRHHGRADTVLTALGTLSPPERQVDWAALFDGTGARHVELPTYAFQRAAVLADVPELAGRLAAAGLDPLTTRCWRPAVSLADGEAMLLTGRLSPRPSRGCADHVRARAACCCPAPPSWSWRCGPPTGRLRPGRRADAGVAAGARRGGRGRAADPGRSRRRGRAPEDHDLRPRRTATPRGRGTRTGSAHGTRNRAPGPRSARPNGRRRGAEAVDVAARTTCRRDGPRLRAGVPGAAWPLAARGELYAEVALPRAGPTPSASACTRRCSTRRCTRRAPRPAADTRARAWLPFSWAGAPLFATGATALRVRLAAGWPPATVALRAVDHTGARRRSRGGAVLAPGGRRAAPRRRRFPRRLAVRDRLGRVRPGRRHRASLRGHRAGRTADARRAGIRAGRGSTRGGVGTGGGARCPRRRPRGGDGVLRSVQMWLADPAGSPPRLAVVTTPGSLTGAAARGLVRSAQSEHPGRFVLVDGTPARSPPRRCTRPWHVRASRRRPRCAAVRSGPRGWPRRDARGAAHSHARGRGGTVLITGGTGCARRARGSAPGHRARRRGTWCWLTRQGLDCAPGRRCAAELAELGAAVRVVACDVADREQLAAVVHRWSPSTRSPRWCTRPACWTTAWSPPLTPRAARRVLRPRSTRRCTCTNSPGTWSSRVRAVLLGRGRLGSAGPGQLRGRQRLPRRAGRAPPRARPARRLAGVGPLGEDSGMTGTPERGRRGAHRRAAAWPPLAAEQGPRAVRRGRWRPATGRPAVLAARLRPGRAASGRRRCPPLLRGLVRRPAPSRQRRRWRPPGWRRRDWPAGPRRPGEALLRLVRGQVAAVLGHSGGDAVEPDRAFNDLGFDSLTAVELRNRLNAATGLRLPATLVSTTRPRRAGRASARRTGRRRRRRRPAAPAGSAAAIGTSRSRSSAMACRLPGRVCARRRTCGGWSPTARDAIVGFPADRGWDLAGSTTRTPSTRARPTRGAAGSSTTRPSSTPSSSGSRRARRSRWIRSSGCCWRRRGRRSRRPASTRRRCAAAGPACSSGVDVPATTPPCWHAARELEGYRLTGNAASVVSGRVAYAFGLEGPAVTVDTACSSSLVALHLAAQALRSGECSLALAGGVTVMATPGDVRRVRAAARAVPGRPVQGVRARARTAPAGPRASGCWCWSGCRTRGATGHQVLAVVRGLGGQPGRRVERADRAQRPVAAAGDPAGAGQRRAVGARRRRGGGARHRHQARAIRSRRRRCWRPTGRTATGGRPLWLGSVKSNIGHTAGRGRRRPASSRWCMAMRHGVLPTDPARRRALTRGRLVVRRGGAADRGAGVARTRTGPGGPASPRSASAAPTRTSSWSKRTDGGPGGRRRRPDQLASAGVAVRVVGSRLGGAAGQAARLRAALAERPDADVGATRALAGDRSRAS